MTAPDSAINQLAERLWLEHGLSEPASKEKAQSLITDAIATIAAAGGKVVWEEV